MLRSMAIHHGGFPIRKSADQSLFAAPRSLSQLVASFFGSWCQGIHLMLLFAWTYLYASSSLYELLEFHKTNNLFGCQFSVKRFYPFCFESFFHLSVKLYFYPNWKDLLIFANLLVLNLCVLLSVRFLLFNTLYSVFNERNPNHFFSSVADTVGWWAQVDSNHRPRAYQARALTTWAMSPCKFFGVSRFLFTRFYFPSLLLC